MQIKQIHKARRVEQLRLQMNNALLNISERKVHKVLNILQKRGVKVITISYLKTIFPSLKEVYLKKYVYRWALLHNQKIMQRKIK